MEEQYDQKDFQWEKTREMFKGMIQGLSLAQMEAAKRIRLMQEQMEKEKQQKNKRELENMQQEKSDKI